MESVALALASALAAGQEFGCAASFMIDTMDFKGRQTDWQFHSRVLVTPSLQTLSSG